MVNQHFSALKENSGLYINGKKIQNTGRTWWKKGHVPWNKGLKNWQERELTGKFINCERCGKEKYFEPNQLKKRPCKYCSVLCARKSERKDRLAYSSIHSRIIKDWGKAQKCEYCGSINTVDWANKSGNYLLDREDWLNLCRKCHTRYDKIKRELYTI